MIHDPLEDDIYVFSNGLLWRVFPHEWQAGDPETSCEEAQLAGAPIRGFGRVWCENLDVRRTLRSVTTGEAQNGMTFQLTQEAMLVNVPARPALIALFQDQSYLEQRGSR